MAHKDNGGKKEYARAVPPPPSLRSGDLSEPAGFDVLREIDDPLLARVLWLGLRRVHFRIARLEERERRAWEARSRPAARSRRRGAATQERVADAREEALLAKAFEGIPLIEPSDPAAEPAPEGPGFSAAQLAEVAAAYPDLKGAVATFQRLRNDPEAVARDEIGRASEEVMTWAEIQEALGTAAHFAEVAAWACASDPRLANEAGRLCRRAALHARSAVWLHRAFHLAVRHRVRGEQVQALLGYGSLRKQQGFNDEAREWFERAARRASRLGLRKQAAKAHHDLLALAAEAGDLPAAIEHMHSALDYYPIRNFRIPWLVHDFAFALVRMRLYSPALGLLIPLTQLRDRANDVVIIQSTYAWAAAGAGRRDRYSEAERVILTLTPHFTEFAAAAFYHLAEGAWRLHDYSRARRHALEALRIALSRDEAGLAEEATDLTLLLTAGAKPEPEREPAMEVELAAATRRLIAALHDQRS